MKKMLMNFTIIAALAACSSKNDLEQKRDIILTNNENAQQYSASGDTAVTMDPATVRTPAVATPAPRRYTPAPVARRASKPAPIQEPVYEPVVNAPQTTVPVPAPAPTTTTPPASTPVPDVVTTGDAPGAGSTGTSTTEPAVTPAKKKGISNGAKGAVIGGVGGAVIGGVIGKGAKGAVIGGVIGAAGGYILGRKKDKASGRIDMTQN